MLNSHLEKSITFSQLKKKKNRWYGGKEGEREEQENTARQLINKPYFYFSSKL